MLSFSLEILIWLASNTNAILNFNFYICDKLFVVDKSKKTKLIPYNKISKTL